MFLVLVGCGRLGFDPLGDAGGSSSTRLHTVYDVYENGPRLDTRIYDSLLDLDCYATPTTSGSRCLPADLTLPQYVDAACTQPVMQVPACDDTVHYAYDPNLLPVDRIFEAGPAIAPPSMAYRLQTDGSCQLQAAPTGMWRSMTAVPFDTFAALTPVLGAGSRVKDEQLVADDGYTTSPTLRDTLLDADCGAATYDDGSECEPYPAGLAVHYTDSGCTHLVFNARGDRGHRRRRDRDRIGRVRLAADGRVHAADRRRWCPALPAPRRGAQPTAVPGAELPASTFAAVTRATGP